MKIRDKLLLGFGFYMLFAVIAGLIAYKDLRRITVRLSLVELADDITNNILEVRRHEKNYLLYKDAASLNEFKEYLDTMKKYVESLRAEIVREIGTKDFTIMKETIARYEATFIRVTEVLASQDELIEMVRRTGIGSEAQLSGKTLQEFLNLRKYEKNLMLEKDKASYQAFLNASETLSVNPALERYYILVKTLYALYKEEQALVEKTRLEAREIQSFTENLSKKERAEIGNVLNMSMRYLVAGLFAIILMGTIINLKLANSIARPIRRLEKITKKVAQGDFSEAIEVTGKDEISSLESSFNQMEEKLKYAMSSLELTVEKLQEKQAQLVEAEKLASIGKLAAGVAHEINNPLTAVLTFSSLMLEQMPADPRRERLSMIVQETNRARILSDKSLVLQKRRR
jgi:HAMP domain-containing protein